MALDHCALCPSKGGLYYIYPLPKELKLPIYQGMSLCSEHQQVLFTDITKFKEEMDASTKSHVLGGRKVRNIQDS